MLQDGFCMRTGDMLTVNTKGAFISFMFTWVTKRKRSKWYLLVVFYFINQGKRERHDEFFVLFF